MGSASAPVITEQNLRKFRRDIPRRATAAHTPSWRAACESSIAPPLFIRARGIDTTIQYTVQRTCKVANELAVTATSLRRRYVCSVCRSHPTKPDAIRRRCAACAWQKEPYCHRLTEGSRASPDTSLLCHSL